MSNRQQLSPRLYFSYSQFLVYDNDVRVPSCAWKAVHVAQGFARRESAVCFSTLLEFGHADVYWTEGAFRAYTEYERVIAVPFKVVSGVIVVDGPDEHDRARTLKVPPGDFELTVAQVAISDEVEVIDLFLRRVTEPLLGSQILVADDELDPPTILSEVADSVFLE